AQPAATTTTTTPQQKLNRAMKLVKWELASARSIDRQFAAVLANKPVLNIPFCGYVYDYTPRYTHTVSAHS
ncbi:unnamed protein product, partial [Ceratitis capitata]